ncbi:MAG TPA: sugar ABC transporter permease [Thermomicrobiales bacterium]|nr:sugar ABC transporter permease [Thermomicrobiales bacterium]
MDQLAVSSKPMGDAAISPGGRTRAIKRSTKKQLYGYLFLAPWLIGFFVLTAGPLFASLYYSFTDFDLLTSSNWVGLSNYTEMFTEDDRYFTSLKVTLTYVVFSVPLSLAFSLLVAMVLNQKLAGMSFYRSVYYLPSLLGGSVSIAILWRQVFGGDGIVNRALAAIGIDGPSWISSPDYALDTLIVLHVWQFGAAMIIFLAGLRQIPQDLYDAAAVDGAGLLSKFARITVPMLSPVVFFNLVLGIIGAFKAFTPAYIVSGGSGGPLDATLFYTLYLYQKAFTSFEMGYASAMAWILLLIIAFFTTLTFVSGKYWVHYGD